MRENWKIERLKDSVVEIEGRRRRETRRRKTETRKRIGGREEEE